MSKMMRINDEIAQYLKELEDMSGLSKQKIVSDALEKLAREYILKKANKQYERLLKDKKFSKEEKENLKDWDSVLADGLNEY